MILHQDRKYNTPDKHAANPLKSLTYNSDRGYMKMGNHDESTATEMVVSVGSKSEERFDGTEASEAAYGIFFGHNSPYNTCGLLNTTSSNTASLLAIRTAILYVLNSVKSAEVDHISHVVIKTSSHYIFDSLCKWVWKMEDPTFKFYNSLAKLNVDVLKEVHELIDWVRVKHNVFIQIWQVAQSFDKQALRLAEEALANKHLFSTPTPFEELSHRWEDATEPVERPWNPSQHWINYQEGQLTTITDVIERVAITLEAPLDRSNAWASSITSLIIRGLLTNVGDPEEVSRRLFIHLGRNKWELLFNYERADMMGEKFVLTERLMRDAGGAKDKYEVIWNRKNFLRERISIILDNMDIVKTCLMILSIREDYDQDEDSGQEPTEKIDSNQLVG